jgi:gamma-glutamylcyclotransferase (GGCT)/AIG2-like uncharacterized protein YtfP
LSCRSTPFSSAMTSYARLLYDNMSDAQVQSIFHELKRESKLQDTTDVDDVEYELFIDQQITSIRNSDLSERNKDSLIERLENARYDSKNATSDNVYAARNILGATGVADIALASVCVKVADDLGANPDLIRVKFNSWRDLSSDEHSYEDKEDYLSEYRYDLAIGVPQDKGTQKALRKLGYEHFLSQPYPVFVYGTLRPGQSNFSLFGNSYYHVESNAIIEDFGIYGAHRGFPYAKDAMGSKTVGDILCVDLGKNGHHVRQSLDSLEGFDSDFPSSSHYERVLRKASYLEAGEPVEVDIWVYNASGTSKKQLRDEDLIPEGDWVVARKAYMQSPLGRRSEYRMGDY